MFIKNFQSNLVSNNLKDKKLNFFTNKSIFDFRNFVNFQFHATQTLTSLSFQLTNKNQKFTIYKKSNNFRIKSKKLFNTKLKYWLDDFHIGGKDPLCQNSLILIKCSNNNKQQTTSFF